MSLARLADARAIIATSVEEAAPQPADSPEVTATPMEESDGKEEDVAIPKEEELAAAVHTSVEDDPDVDISPTPSENENLEDSKPSAPTPQAEEKTATAACEEKAASTEETNAVPDTFTFSEGDDDERDDDGVSPPTTPQHFAVGFNVEVVAPTISIDRKESSGDDVSEHAKIPSQSEISQSAVVSNLAAPSTYPLDDISQNVSVANSATPTPLVAALETVVGGSTFAPVDAHDNTKDITISAAASKITQLTSPEVISEVAAPAAVISPPRVAALELEENAPEKENDSIVTFRDSTSKSAAPDSLPNSVNVIGPFDANAIPDILAQQPSRHHSNSGSSSVETESSEEEEFDMGVATSTRLDRAFTFPVSPRHSVMMSDFETQQPEVLTDPLAQLEINSEPYARMLLEKRMLNWDVALSDPKKEDYFGRTAILPLRSYYADTFIAAICTEVSRHEVMDRVFIAETEAEIWETVIIKEGYTSIQELLVEDKASRFDRKLQNKLLKSMTKKALGGSSFRSGSSMRERSPTPDPHSNSTSSRQNTGGAPLELSMRSSASTALRQLLNQQTGAIERKNSISGIRRSISFNTTHNTTDHEEPLSLPPKRNNVRKDSGLHGLGDYSPLHTLPSVTATSSGLDAPDGGGVGGGEWSNSSSVIVAAISPHSIRRPTECFTPETTINKPLNSNVSLPEATTLRPSLEANNNTMVLATNPPSLMKAGGEGEGGHPARSSSPIIKAEQMPQFDAPAESSGEQAASKSGDDPMMTSSPRPPKHSLRRLTQSLMALMPGSLSSRPLGASRSNSRSVISRSKPQQRPSSAEAANRLREASMRVSTIHDMLDGNHPLSSGGTSPTERDRNNPEDQQIDAIRKAASNALDCSQIESELSSSRVGSPCPPASPRAAGHGKDGYGNIVRRSDDLIRFSSSAAMSIRSDDDAPQHDGNCTALKSKDSFSPAALQPFQQVQLQAEYDDDDDDKNDGGGVENDAEAALLAAEDEGIMTRLDVPIDGMAKNADVEQSVRIGRSVFDPTNERLYHVVGEGEDEFAVEDDISSPDSSESSSLEESSDEADDDQPSAQPHPPVTTNSASQQRDGGDEGDEKREELNFNTGSATTSENQNFQINGDDEDATTSDVLELLQGGEEEEEGEEDNEL
jgi:hypothetical protein